jgi:hypothetical protein
MPEDRIRRPSLDRTKPIRHPSALFGARGPAAAREPVLDAAASNAAPAGGATPQDVVFRSVSLGYSVIDDYIRRGQRAAQELRQGTYGADALAGDLQDIGARMVQYLSDFTATWAEFLERAGGNGAREARPTRPVERPARESGAAPHHVGGTPAARAGESADATPIASARSQDSPASQPPSSVPQLRVRVELSTRRRAQLALDLKPLPSGCRLTVHALRTTAGGPRLDQVSFQAGVADTGTIRLCIPDDHPPGTYSGVVIDEESNRPVGTLTVVLEPADRG